MHRKKERHNLLEQMKDSVQELKEISKEGVQEDPSGATVEAEQQFQRILQMVETGVGQLRSMTHRL
ncbi:MAG: hypothetical protein WDZ70_02735 [Candidatus Paceibacterota bacterium]